MNTYVEKKASKLNFMHCKLFPIEIDPAMTQTKSIIACSFLKLNRNSLDKKSSNKNFPNHITNLQVKSEELIRVTIQKYQLYGN